MDVRRNETCATRRKRQFSDGVIVGFNFLQFNDGALKIRKSYNRKIKSRFYIRRLYARSYLWTLEEMKHVLLEENANFQTVSSLASSS
jgi:hypothetical protein